MVVTAQTWACHARGMGRAEVEELTAARRTTRGRRRFVVAGLVVLLALLLVLAATRDLRERAWVERCEARGGAVTTLPPEAPNPLLAQSDEPGLRCVAADGSVLAERR